MSQTSGSAPWLLGSVIFTEIVLGIEAVFVGVMARENPYARNDALGHP